MQSFSLCKISQTLILLYLFINSKYNFGQAWWYVPILWKADARIIFEIEAGLIYLWSSRPAGATGTPCLKTKKQLYVSVMCSVYVHT